MCNFPSSFIQYTVNFELSSVPSEWKSFPFIFHFTNRVLSNPSWRVKNDILWINKMSKWISFFVPQFSFLQKVTMSCFSLFSRNKNLLFDVPKHLISLTDTSQNIIYVVYLVRPPKNVIMAVKQYVASAWICIIVCLLIDFNKPLSYLPGLGLLGSMWSTQRGKTNSERYLSLEWSLSGDFCCDGTA